VANVRWSENSAALINLCAFPAVPQGKRNTMVNYTRSVERQRALDGQSRAKIFRASMRTE
jgi:hypothetical protein